MTRTVTNAWGVYTVAGVPPTDVIVEGAGIMDGHARWKHPHAGSLPDDPARRKADRNRGTFEKLAAGRTFVRMTVNRTDLWITETGAAKIKAAGIKPDKGRIVFSAPGLPCETLVNPFTGLAAVGQSRPCGRLANPETGLCGIHAAAEARRDANRAAYEEAWAADRAADRHEEETRRRSEEILTAARSLLEALGIRPDTVNITRTGAVNLPSEAFDRLLRKAHEVIEMEDMGVL